MRLWPEWAEREANNPPPGFPPRWWRIFWRWQGFDTVVLLVGIAFTVLVTLLLLVLVLLGAFD
jgi:hypothetical protein